MICLLLIFSLARLAALTGALSMPVHDDDTSENNAETWAEVAGLQVDSLDMTYRSLFLFVINEYEEGRQQQQQQLRRQNACFDTSFRPWQPRTVECYTVPRLSMISGELSKLEIITLKLFAYNAAKSEEERSQLLNEGMLVNITSVEEDMRDFRFSISIDGVNSREIVSSAHDYVTENLGQEITYLRNRWQPKNENVRRIQAV